MCYAIPGKITAINGDKITVDYFGEEKKARNETLTLSVGDYVSAQGGFIIKKITEIEAKEILAAWQELFFSLKNLDLRLSKLDLTKENISKKTALILDRALEGYSLKKEDLVYLFNLSDQNEIELLYRTANFLRQKFHSNACCVHAIIEISNYCKKNCHYCGIRQSNLTPRYRLDETEIMLTVKNAVDNYGLQAIVLQSGEDDGLSVSQLAKLIERIKRETNILVCISFGEIGIDNLKTLYQAGARAILLRFETSNPALYSKLRPSCQLNSRIAHLKAARKLGYLIMTGSLIGLPGQTTQDLINDILLAKELGTEMYSFGPFLAHPQTPLANQPSPTIETILKTLALVRLVDPQEAKILVTTAFETLLPSARKHGLLAGANTLMLTATPLAQRAQYSIYPNKISLNEDLRQQVNDTIDLLKSLGRAPTDIGV